VKIHQNFVNFHQILLKFTNIHMDFQLTNFFGEFYMIFFWVDLLGPSEAQLWCKTYADSVSRGNFRLRGCRWVDQTGNRERHCPRTMTTGLWLDKQWESSGMTGVGWQEILVDLLIQSDLWSRSNHGLMSFVTTISRIMSSHCSIRAHLERFTIVEDPINDRIRESGNRNFGRKNNCEESNPNMNITD
jgi:hypothetical protein